VFDFNYVYCVFFRLFMLRINFCVLDARVLLVVFPVYFRLISIVNLI
jgi:hypothetical protein